MTSRALKRTPRERDIEAKCGRIAKARGCKFLKLSPLFAIGVVDRLVVLPRGRVWWVEFKRPGNEPTVKQTATILSLQALGHDVTVISDPDIFAWRLDERLSRK